MGELQDLYRLQQLETQLGKLKKVLKDLPVIAEFNELKSEFSDARENLDWAKTKLTEHNKRVRRLEQDLQQTEEEQKMVQADLYGDSDQTAKELEQLDNKSRALLAEHGKQEETLILAMEGKEELEETVVQATEKYSGLRKKLRTMQKTGNEEIQSIKAEIDQLQEQRRLLLHNISSPLLEEYRKRREQFHGRPLAQIANDICSGCRVTVSSETKRKLRLAKNTVYCDNCGRLLIPVQQEDA